MPPEETVICNQMNEKQMNEKQMDEKQNQELPTITLMHVMRSSGRTLKSLGGGFLCILFALCLCSCVEHTWR